MEKNPVFELPANEYNQKLSEILKSMSEFKMPEWAAFVKTGVSKDRPPVEKDFWFKRAASILRQIYINKVVGVNRLRTRYGSKQNRGMKPERFKKSSGKIIRVILQQAESAGLLEKYKESGKRAGRKLTDKGKELLGGVGNSTEQTKETSEQISNPTEQTKESSVVGESTDVQKVNLVEDTKEKDTKINKEIKEE